MAMVWPWELSVDEYAGAGRAVAVPRALCPGCQAAMVFCGWYRRAVRDVGLVVYLIEVRRARCGVCRGQNHALLPSFCLRGRLDVVEVIGSAVSAVVMDKAVVTAPAEPDAGVPATTVRGWVRAHRRRAEGLLVGLVDAAGIGGRHGRVAGSIAEAALAAVVELGWALAGCLGVGLWPAVSVLTNGLWLCVRRNPRWEGAALGRWMILMTALGPP